jgi:hypothetical protein
LDNHKHQSTADARHSLKRRGFSEPCFWGPMPRQRRREGGEGCERLLRAPLVIVRLTIVPRQRHWMINDRCLNRPIIIANLRNQHVEGVGCDSNAADAAWSTITHYEGCSQKALAPLAILFQPLTRRRSLGKVPARRPRLTMKTEKVKRLAKADWKLGDAKDFLGLDASESQFVEIELGLRAQNSWTQADLVPASA